MQAVSTLVDNPIIPKIKQPPFKDGCYDAV